MIFDTKNWLWKSALFDDPFKGEWKSNQRNVFEQLTLILKTPPLRSHYPLVQTLVSLLLEPVCCKKQPKKVPDQLLVCGIGDLWRTCMIPNWSHCLHLVLNTQETLGYSERDTSSVLCMIASDSPDHPGSILYHSESSEVPYFTNQ